MWVWAVVACVFGFLLLGVAFLIGKARLKRGWRFGLAAPFFAAGSFIAVLSFMGLVTDWSLPTKASLVTRIQAAAERKDRAALVEALQKDGFIPIVFREKYRGRMDMTWVSRPPNLQAASHVELSHVKMRARDLFAEYLMVELLFDANEQLLGWGYWIYSPVL